MRLPQDVQSVRIPRNTLPRSSGARGSSRARRDLSRHLRSIVALRALGVQAVPEIVDASGATVADAQLLADLAEVEAALHALSSGPAAHARQTLDHVAAESRGDDDEVSRALDEAYRGHADGHAAEEVLDAFLDHVQPWLTPRGVPRIDRLFETLDLARAPESLGVLLLAITRLTRQHFSRRGDFVDRFAAFLMGRGGRTAAQVEAMLRGLRA